MSNLKFAKTSPIVGVFEKPKQTDTMGAKTTTWNEFSSTMASAVICLATNQNFNFSKYIFDNMVKNLEGGVKFLMYPRFVQVFLDKQVEGMTKHKAIYVTPSHTKNVFANMKRGGKGFSWIVTPLFRTMMVQAPEELELITDEASNAEHVPTHFNDPLFNGEDRLQLKELLELSQLNVELEEEEKLAKPREEDANIAEWDNVQAMIDVDYELAARL
ncbi:hypothetical protein Tco_0966707 [Tanacetum coccineum]